MTTWDQSTTGLLSSYSWYTIKLSRLGNLKANELSNPWSRTGELSVMSLTRGGRILPKVLQTSNPLPTYVECKHSYICTHMAAISLLRTSPNVFSNGTVIDHSKVAHIIHSPKGASSKHI